MLASLAILPVDRQSDNHPRKRIKRLAGLRIAMAISPPENKPSLYKSGRRGLNLQKGEGWLENIIRIFLKTKFYLNYFAITLTDP